jgi:hypothetical protein
MVEFLAFENWFVGVIVESLATCEEIIEDVLSMRILPLYLNNII